ncbi:O-antigen ligase family protein [Clostridium intestinale]|uniref:O-antigen polymerase n=1 Tax=Clostridium intestinale URNW TaxID=1294142 RepID=U2N1X3_9CLOT|nr:O-antigen ligase family protein [Clostridium intestinale]ERK29502.1 hypothetical protein CINTURNW_3189 [Clostridium intestinale URNW]
MLDLLVMLIPIILPITFLGERLGNLLIVLIGIIYLFINKPKAYNKKFIYLNLIFIGMILISIIYNGLYIYSLSGVAKYIILPIYYLVFKNINIKTAVETKERNIRILLILSAIMTLGYILYQGVYYDARLYGSLGYANSYAVLLLLLLVINNIVLRDKEKWTKILDVIYILGIIYSGSRTSILLLILSVIFFKIDKGHKSNFIFESFVVAMVSYIMCEKLGLLGIIILPVLFYLYSGYKGFKDKKILYSILSIMVIITAVLVPENSFERLRNISLTNASFLERIITFQDSINSASLLGYGIDSFQYNQFKYQTAFYDIKYIHNSVLQSVFDLGLIGGTLFVLVILYGIYLVIKREKKFNYYTFVPSIVFLHSLLDFDLVYGSIMVLTVFISTYKYDYIKDIKNEKDLLTYKLGLGIFILLLMIPIYNESIIIISTKLINNSRFEEAEKVSNLSHFNDWRITRIKGEIYRGYYDLSKDNKYLEKMKNILEEGYNTSKDNLILKWNLAYVYDKLGQENEALTMRMELLKDEKYYFETYKEIYKYAEDNKILSDEERKNLLSEIENVHESAIKNLNPKARYLKNQLKPELRETLIFKREGEF